MLKNILWMTGGLALGLAIWAVYAQYKKLKDKAATTTPAPPAPAPAPAPPAPGGWPPPTGGTTTGGTPSTGG